MSLPWLHGTIDRQTAEYLLAANGAEDGLFLIRLKDIGKQVYALSFTMKGKPLHSLLEQVDNGFLLNGNPFLKTTDLAEVIDAMKIPFASWKYCLTSYIHKDTLKKQSLDNKPVIDELMFYDVPNSASTNKFSSMGTSLSENSTEHFNRQLGLSTSDTSLHSTSSTHDSVEKEDKTEIDDPVSEEYSVPAVEPIVPTEGSLLERPSPQSRSKQRMTSVMSSLKKKSLTLLKRKRQSSTSVFETKVNYIGGFQQSEITVESFVIDEVAQQAIEVIKMAPPRQGQLFVSHDGFTIMTTDKERDVLCQQHFSNVYGLGKKSDFGSAVVVVIFYYVTASEAAARAVAIQSKDTSCYEALAGALEAAHNFNVFQPRNDAIFVNTSNSPSNDMDLSSLQEALQKK